MIDFDSLFGPHVAVALFVVRQLPRDGRRFSMNQYRER